MKQNGFNYTCKNSKNQNLLVSVVVVSRNAKNTIKRCLDNILNQTYPNIEIVVVDSSDDETKEILEEYKNKSKFPFKIIHQEPKGVGAARNAGILNANGEIITGADVDVFIPKDFVEKIAEPFNKLDKVMGVLAKDLIKSSSNSLFSDLVCLYENLMLKEIPVYNTPDIGIKSFRKKFINKIGGFDEELKSGEDAPFWNKVAKVKKELEDQGYLFPVVDTITIEEKQGQSFKEYWKRCIWYGKPLANLKYLKNNLKVNISKIVGAAYITMLPFAAFAMLAYSFALWQILLLFAPIIGLLFYIMYKATLKKVMTWKLILIPVVLYYKSFWTFVGFVIGILGR